MKKIISLGLACALAVSPLSCNFAFANEPVAESKVSTTNNENSKCKVDEETLNKLAEKLKKANKEELNNLLEQLPKEKTETKQLRSDLSEIKSKLRTFFWGFFFTGIFGSLAVLKARSSPNTSILFCFFTGIIGLIANIAGLSI